MREPKTSEGFNEAQYTREATVKQLLLIELHSSDGSAYEAGCSCIEEKHLFALEGLAEEGTKLGKTEAEKNFYKQLAEWARVNRKAIIQEQWSLNVSHCPPCKCSEPH